MAFVTGAGPVSFSDSVSGAQYLIPLTSLRFDDNGQISATAWAPYANLQSGDKTALDKWLAHLAATGALTAPPKDAPAEAARITAKQAGSSGNRITAVISDVNKTAGTCKIILTETDTYENLDLAGITAALNSRPGLVRVKSLGTDPPAATTTAPLKLISGSPTVKATVAVPAVQSGTAFTLEARDAGAAGNDITVNISIPDPNNTNKFTLVARWTREKTGAPPDFNTEFDYLVSIVLPPGPTRLPAAGTYVLRGGSEPGPSVAASTILLTA
jgi:hypothetical protein